MIAIGLLSSKGGQGKSVTARTLAAALVEKGKRVVIIDADPQGNLSTYARPIELPGTLVGVLDGSISPTAAAVEISRGTRLIGADLELAELAASADGNLPERLKAAVDRLDADAVLVDTPPAVNPLSVATRYACPWTVVPIIMGRWAIEGLVNLVDRMKIDPKHLLVLPTFHDRRTRVAREGLDYIRERFGGCVLDPVPRTVKIEEATAYQTTILERGAKHPASEAYRKLATEILERAGV